MRTSPSYPDSVEVVPRNIWTSPCPHTVNRRPGRASPGSPSPCASRKFVPGSPWFHPPPKPPGAGAAPGCMPAGDDNPSPRPGAPYVAVSIGDSKLMAIRSPAARAAAVPSGTDCPSTVSRDCSPRPAITRRPSVIRALARCPRPIAANVSPATACTRWSFTVTVTITRADRARAPSGRTGSAPSRRSLRDRYTSGLRPDSEPRSAHDRRTTGHR